MVFSSQRDELGGRESHAGIAVHACMHAGDGFECASGDAVYSVVSVSGFGDLRVTLGFSEREALFVDGFGPGSLLLLCPVADLWPCLWDVAMSSFTVAVSR